MKIPSTPESRLVIHVGPRKTATTYLQQNFFRATSELEQKGWIYPVISNRVRNAHHEVASVRKFNGSQKIPVMKRLKAAATRARAAHCGLLLSSEGFSRWKGRDLAALARHLGYSSVTIVWMLRDPVSILASVWSEAVKNGASTSLPEFVAKHMADPTRSSLVNPVIELKPLFKTDGIDLRVLNYEAIRESGADVFSEFCRIILGLDDMKPERVTEANTRRPVEFTEFLRMLAPSVKRSRENFGVMFGRAVERRLTDRQIDAIVSDIAARKDTAGRIVTVSRDEPWYRQMESRLVEMLGDRLQPPARDGRIFPSGTLSLACYDRDALEADAAIAAHARKVAGKMRAGVINRLWTKARLRLLSMRRGFGRLFRR